MEGRVWYLKKKPGREQHGLCAFVRVCACTGAPKEPAVWGREGPPACRRPRPAWPPRAAAPEPQDLLLHHFVSSLLCGLTCSWMPGPRSGRFAHDGRGLSWGGGIKAGLTRETPPPQEALGRQAQRRAGPGRASSRHRAASLRARAHRHSPLATPSSEPGGPASPHCPCAKPGCSVLPFQLVRPLPAGPTG